MKGTGWLFGVVLLAAAAAAAQDESRPVPVIPWASSRKLTVGDFKGKVPASASNGSISQVSIQVSSLCEEGIAHLDVQAIFDPNLSWWRDPLPNLWRDLDAPFAASADRGSSLLAHEQLHFDLTELWARRMSAALEALGPVCGTPAAEASVNKTVADIEKRWREEQQRYDRQTNNGLDARQQKAWQIRTATALASHQLPAATPAAR